MFFNRFAKRDTPYPLIVGMTGVKLGDRIAYVGGDSPGPLAALAAKVGLSGRAVAIVNDDAIAARVQKAAAKQGVLVDVEIAPSTKIPLDAASIDVAILDDTAGSFSVMPAEDRGATIRELARIVRPGGRAMIIGAGTREGLRAWLYGQSSGPSVAASGEAVTILEADGFKPARTLAEREGLIFVEGLRPR